MSCWSFMMLTNIALLLMNGCAADAGTLKSRGYRLASHDEGMTMCHLQGQVPSSVASKEMLFKRPVTVNLHVFLRVVNDVAEGKIYVRGFVFMADHTTFSIHAHDAQMRSSPAFHTWPGNVILRCPYTHKQYPLQLLKNDWQPASSHVLIGEFPTVNTQQGAPMEFWFEAGGIEQRCYVLATEMKETDIKPSPEFQALAKRQPVSAYKVRWPLVTFYNLTTNEFALLVKSHVDWHAKLGVHQHIVYITEAVLAAASHPVIQSMVADGSVEIVFWDILALNYNPVDSTLQGDKHILSQHQNLMYAHAALTYWMTPTYLVLGDLDEYFMTAKPTTIAEVMRNNIYAASQLLSVLNVQIVDAFCVACEADGVRELDTWANTTYTKGLHPISMYELQRQERESGGWYPDKDICDVNMVGHLHIHEARQLEGRRFHVRKTDDIIFLHMRNLYTERVKDEAIPYEKSLPSDASFWWPIKATPQHAMI